MEGCIIGAVVPDSSGEELDGRSYNLPVYLCSKSGQWSWALSSEWNGDCYKSFKMSLLCAVAEFNSWRQDQMLDI